MAVRKLIEKLKNEDGFNLLLDITAIDYLKYPDVTVSRFALVYIFRDKNLKESSKNE